MTYKRIVVPSDLSDFSLAALDYAIEFARSHGAELLVVHMIEPISHTRFIPDVAAILEHQRNDAAGKLAELEKRIGRRLKRFRTEIHFGLPHQQIPDIARRFGADLIIMATHGHTGLDHFFLGSVAERVVRFADCPVLTLKPKKTEAHTRIASHPGGKRTPSKREKSRRGRS